MLRWVNRKTDLSFAEAPIANCKARASCFRPLALALAILAAGALLIAGQLPANAQGKSPAINVSVNAANIKTLDEPLKLDASEPMRFKVSVHNPTSSDVHVTTVSFEGKVVGLPVFRCEGLMSLVVPPGGSGEQEFEMDSDCLKDQATGLMPARIAVYSPNRVELESWSLTLDIKGSLKSIYGLFGIALAALTVLSLLGGLISLARHKLSPNRWSRAMRFAVPGIGLGFTIVFALAAGGIAVPTATMWIPIVGTSFALLGLFGYFSPRPDEPDDFAPLPQPGFAGDTVVMPPGAAITSPMPQAPQAGQVPIAAQAPVAPEYPPAQIPTDQPSTIPPPSQTVRRIAPEDSPPE